VAATGAVEIVDFKGHYNLEIGDEAKLLAMAESAIAAFPDALLEDGHDLPGVTDLLKPHEHRISYDAPIHTVADLDATPLRPRAVNIKPCRVGDLRSLFDLYAEVDRRGMIVYGGGMGELDVGRGQIQLLASLFHPDGPNDTAPAATTRPRRRPTCRTARCPRAPRRRGSAARYSPSCAASWSSTVSSGAISWMPSGNPSEVSRSGSEIAAKPETLAMGVQPVVANSTRKNSCVEPRGWLRWASGGGPAH
jgi:hypothetical protein